mmetsp:Transcript_10730/g.13374  ORF Transcript_10730/g.13374 Transcript_10730/m.13374 type:complete len:219 (+) Transcript_10730:40-696(+)
MPMMYETRLRKELKKIEKDPSPYFKAKPTPNDIRIWHFVLFGDCFKDTPYDSGYYHGCLKFPNNYPYKPPSIYMFTPNGRFQINTKICTTNSDFHPESWSPFWSVSNIIMGIISIMSEESNGIGALKLSDNERKILAKNSLIFNSKNTQFKQLFPELYQIFLDKKNNGVYSMDVLNSTKNLSDINSSENQNQSDIMLNLIIFCVIIIGIAWFYQNYIS